MRGLKRTLNIQSFFSLLARHLGSLTFFKSGIESHLFRSPGNYPQALEDFQECLSLQLKHLPPHSRLLAETHYHVATTLCYMDQYSQAIQHYNSSIKVIETRLGRFPPLKSSINSDWCGLVWRALPALCDVLIYDGRCKAMLQEVIAAAEGTDGAAEEKVEMEELKQLLPDIREKVEDAKESQRTASAASQAIQQTLVSKRLSEDENHGRKCNLVYVGLPGLVLSVQLQLGLFFFVFLGAVEITKFAASAFG